MESHWKTATQAPIYLFAVPDEKNAENMVQIQVCSAFSPFASWSPWGFISLSLYLFWFTVFSKLLALFLWFLPVRNIEKNPPGQKQNHKGGDAPPGGQATDRFHLGEGGGGRHQ